MKVRSTTFDQYKFSIEPHPLQALYSKYNATETPHCQSVRPLGKIRQEMRPFSEYQNPGVPQAPVSGGADMKREINTNRAVYSGRDRHKCEQNISSLDIRDKENSDFQGPTLSRSKTQAFENKFKIASSRLNGQESPSPTSRPMKHGDKKVVHLPLYKINLRTYCPEEDVSRTVAKTRESLRKLMELNKAKMKNANVITANIKNYEFNAPRASTSFSMKGNRESAGTLVSQPFHARPALRSLRDRESKVKQSTLINTVRKFGVAETSRSADNVVFEDLHEKPIVTKRQFSDVIEMDDEPDCSMLSLAIRPDTSLTLGTTMHQIDRVIKSPTSDELRELSEAFKNTDASPAWPSIDDIQTLLARSQSRTTKSPTKSRTPFSRPTTVQHHATKPPDDDWIQKNNKSNYLHYLPYEHGHRPVIRYTSKQSSYKLDPIIVPSHTCTECPMCNIYQREVETPCPPNTPNTSQFMYDPETRPVFIRGATISNMYPANQDVLRITRMNMNGRASPQEDPGVLTYMKGI